MTTKRIPPPVSPTLATVSYVCAVACFIGGVLSLVNSQSGLPVAIGCALMAGPTLAARARTQALAERDEAGPDSPVRYEDPPAEPDLVRIGTIAGLLSFVTMPILFGPAAVLCGAAALVNGHLKGLWGLGLGAAGLTGWALIVYHFSQ